MDWSVFDGVAVGHVTDLEHATGVTVLLFEQGATAGMELRGGATSTFGTDAANPLHLVPHLHAIVFTGGSVFGLESVFGVMRWLEERGIGFDTQVARVPIVSGAVVAWNLILLARYGLNDLPHAGPVALDDLWVGQFRFLLSIGRHLEALLRGLLRLGP